MDGIQKADGFQNECLFVLPGETQDRLSKNDLFRFLLVTDIGYFPRARYHFRQRHEGCSTSILLYCSAGSGFYAVNGGERKNLSAGHIVMIPPHTPHVYGASEEEPWSVYWAHSRGLFFEPYYGMLSSRLPVEVSEMMGEKIKDLFRQCFTILKSPWQNEEYFYVCQLIGTVMAMISCIGKRTGSQIALRGTHGIDKAIAFINEHLHENVTLKELAEASGLSLSHLHNLFQRSTGFAPIEYFLQAKMLAASRDLYFSELPVKDIAYSYGVEDPYYFSRIFKKIMGVSPQQYRSMVKG
ncbi:MAG: AraC family transcriptional regulator [Treponema sp.]|jgi:AraC-like DNA-binding protein|nr:AraC family transcriptional regulator [Treponema sp.]